MQRPPKNLVGLWSLILYNSQTFFCPRQIPGLGIFLKMAHLRLPKVPFGERRSRTVCSDCMAGVQGTCEHCSTNLYIYVYKYTPLFEMWLTARRNTHTHPFIPQNGRKKLEKLPRNSTRSKRSSRQKPWTMPPRKSLRQGREGLPRDPRETRLKRGLVGGQGRGLPKLKQSQPRGRPRLLPQSKQRSQEGIGNLHPWLSRFRIRRQTLAWTEQGQLWRNLFPP